MEVTVRRSTVLRRSLVLVMVLAAAGYRAHEVTGQQAPQPTAEQLLSEILDAVGGRQLAITKLTVPPGAGAMEHRHSAYLGVYVLSGQIASAVDGQEPTLYGPGDVWYEAHLQLHSTFHNPSRTEPAILIVFALRDADHPAVRGTAAGPDWPQWRGPDRNGIVPSADLPDPWPPELERRWRVEIGEGYAAPVLIGDRLYTFSRQGGAEVMRALDATTGTEIWATRYDAPVSYRPGADAHGPGPKATPTYANGRLFTLGLGGVISAFDAADGSIVWRVPEPEVSLKWGTAMSPLVDGNRVIVHVGSEDQGVLTAYDWETGDVVWAWDGDGPSYASGLVAEVAGVRQLITLSNQHAIGVAVETGELLWQRPFSAFDQNIVDPVLVGDDLVVIAGHMERTIGFRLRPSANGWSTDDVWETRDAALFMTNPVRLDETTLFGMTERNSGQYFIQDLSSGEILWTSAPRRAENAAILRAGNTLLILEDVGELVIARANAREGLEELRRYTVADSPTWAVPALSGRRIYVKDRTGVSLWTWD